VVDPFIWSTLLQSTLFFGRPYCSRPLYLVDPFVVDPFQSTLLQSTLFSRPFGVLPRLTWGAYLSGEIRPSRFLSGQLIRVDPHCTWTMAWRTLQDSNPWCNDLLRGDFGAWASLQQRRTKCPWAFLCCYQSPEFHTAQDWNLGQCFEPVEPVSRYWILSFQSSRIEPCSGSKKLVSGGWRRSFFPQNIHHNFSDEKMRR